MQLEGLVVAGDCFAMPSSRRQQFGKGRVVVRSLSIPANGLHQQRLGPLEVPVHCGDLGEDGLSLMVVPPSCDVLCQQFFCGLDVAGLHQ
jgi:hypothetical protein